ncbi:MULTISPECIES: hypothetical protein [unclassified Pseudomonas]|uniref:hypothetical protein n=1 Tax=unclassified Pseudomonas TaxID=196821 RepID=UPI000837F0B9|nr:MULTISPECIES: hypothetical protein [unclassified Pseudomonas]QIH05132.1 hypothetical protein ATY02_07460 [Pseudomonas sp. BIOMIG1BAC]
MISPPARPVTPTVEDDLDFSLSKKTLTGLDQKANEAREYLRQTDWLVVRKLETGKEVPADVAEKRAEARSLI